MREFRERHRVAAGADLPAGELHGIGVDAPELGHMGSQARLELATRVFGRHAIEVRAARCCRGRRVWHLAGVGCSDAHLVDGNAEFARYHLHHLGMQALAHLGATVVEQHRAIRVEVDQGTSLVEVRRVERNAELDWRQRQAALDNRARGVLRLERHAACAVVRRCFQFARDRLKNIVFNGLPVGRLVAIRMRNCAQCGCPDGPVAVVIDTPYIERIEPQMSCNAVDRMLDHEHALRPAKAPKRGVRYRVGLALEIAYRYVFQKVGVVDVADGTVVDRPGKIGRVAAV